MTFFVITRAVMEWLYGVALIRRRHGQLPFGSGSNRGFKKHSVAILPCNRGSTLAAATYTREAP